LAALGLSGPKGPTGSSPGRDACGDPSGGGTVPGGPVYESWVDEAGRGPGKKIPRIPER